MFTLLNKANALRRVVLFALFAITCTRAGTNPERWAISIHSDGERGSDPLHLELTLVEGDPLVGTFAADALRPEESKGYSPIAIEGHKGKDGTFWPNVELQVKMKDGNWLKIASSLDDAVSAKVTIFAGMGVHGLLINLEPFRKYIGTCQFGRVLLKSGEVAQVNLDLLTNRSN